MDEPAIEGMRARLHRQRGRYQEVCRRSGLGYSWLSKFASRERGKRPAWESIERLTRALESMEAEEVRRKR